LYLRRDFSILQIALEYSGVTALGENHLVFNQPLSLICGENGVGKTTLLRVLHRSLVEGVGDWEKTRTDFPAAAVSGTIRSLVATIKGTEDRTTQVIGSSGFWEYREQKETPPDVVFLDTSTLIPSLLRLLRMDQNVGDLIEGVTPRILDGEELSTVRQLVGRDYEQVEIFEIADYSDVERLPYFRVTMGEASYGSEGMGTGELALLYLFWTIEGSPQESVILLEEPESFIAPRSQRTFIDWLASRVVDKKLFVVVSSHSGQIVERFPLKSILLCTRVGTRTVVQQAPPIHLLVERLGILGHRRCLLLVEDSAAEALAHALIRALEPRLYMECDVVIATSNGHITKALIHLPMIASKRIVAIGVYDGDQEGLATEKVPWPKVFLPGKMGPEALLREICSSESVQNLSEALNVDEVELAAVLGGAAGAEDHDWLTRVAHGLDRDLKTLFREVVPLWIESHDSDAERFLKAIVEAARRPF
jgi:energy-coupling factor transporter ATP-binding protein EcfA2